MILEIVYGNRASCSADRFFRGQCAETLAAARVKNAWAGLVHVAEYRYTKEFHRFRVVMLGLETKSLFVTLIVSLLKAARKCISRMKIFSAAIMSDEQPVT